MSGRQRASPSAATRTPANRWRRRTSPPPGQDASPSSTRSRGTSGRTRPGGRSASALASPSRSSPSARLGHRRFPGSRPRSRERGRGSSRRSKRSARPSAARAYLGPPSSGRAKCAFSRRHDRGRCAPNRRGYNGCPSKPRPAPRRRRTRRACARLDGGDNRSGCGRRGFSRSAHEQELARRVWSDRHPETRRKRAHDRRPRQVDRPGRRVRTRSRRRGLPNGDEEGAPTRTFRSGKTLNSE